jgi:hypothetical protein
MQITLRKANAIQIAINEALKGLEFSDTLDINEFQDAEAEIDAAAGKFGKSLIRRGDLITALYEIRTAVSAANNSAGIDTLLASVAKLEKDITFYSTYAKSQVRTDMAVVEGKLARLRNTDEGRRGWNRDNVSTTIFDQAAIDNFRDIAATAKKQKQKLQDKLLELNVSTKIDLSDVTVSALEAENIL